MVTNVMVNFLIFTHGYTKLSKIEIILPKYQLYSVTYLMKITQINGRNKLNTAVKYKINV